MIWAYEEYRQDWAWDFYGLLLRIKNSKEDHFPLKPKEIKAYKKEYDQILCSGFAENPSPKNMVVKRGKPKRGKILSLLDRLRDHKESVLMFMMEKDVPFDNNLAERDIRMIRVQQKVSGTFRSRAGARAFCRIRSFISSTRKQGYKAFQAIQDALNGRCLIYMGEQLHKINNGLITTPFKFDSETIKYLFYKVNLMTNFCWGVLEFLIC